MVFEHTDYRTYLRRHLDARIAKNPAYSLRSFAKQIQITPSYLSEVCSGRKNLSEKKASEIARKLELPPKEAEYFCLLVQRDKSRTPELIESLQDRIDSMRNAPRTVDLDLESFKMIAEWYHIPILEMTQLTDFEFSPRTIAKRLGITTIEADAAVTRLVRLGLLTKNESGRYEKTQKKLMIKSERRNDALRLFHKQMLRHGIQSVDSQLPNEKFIGSGTYPIAKEQLDAAKEIIEECFAKLNDLFSSATVKDQVYHLNVALFNLTDSDFRETLS